jgi:hypothetical protein
MHPEYQKYQELKLQSVKNNKIRRPIVCGICGVFDMEAKKRTDETVIKKMTDTLVHRGEYYIGLRPSTLFLKKGETLGFDVIAANPRGDLAREQ